MAGRDVAGITWTSRAGIYFGTGDTHTYRISKQYFGTAPTNFTWQPECRPHIDADGNEDTEWQLVSKSSHIKHSNTLKRAKSWCLYHAQGGFEGQS